MSFALCAGPQGRLSQGGHFLSAVATFMLHCTKNQGLISASRQVPLTIRFDLLFSNVTLLP
jgi:hypothetical protein